ncbi:MAG TPA: FAD-linked oxidase C-terminal domain-containing protein [Thermodesulfobacteriota bacterium]|nr:FAD-linked oxidase C-terminal domain-containing protein [Thermodesulfobacteriota bacterium]
MVPAVARPSPSRPAGDPARDEVAADLEAALRRELRGEVRFDPYTRHLYSTDASMYAIEPIGVAFPRDADDIQAAVAVARRFRVPLLARGAGTSLAGQTVGRAVVLDCSRYLTAIVELDREGRRARVQPGVVQDDLNRAAARVGLAFGPDTSTSNRATLGGMIGNNSAGTHSVFYGMTIDHVEALDVVLADGSRTRLAPVERDELARRARPDTLEGRIYRELPPLVEAHRAAIAARFPEWWRRAGGYRLDRLAADGPFDLAKFVVGSEGTLVLVTEATVRLVEKPRAVVMGVGQFETVAAAIAATEDALACRPAAVELLDKTILDLARRSREFDRIASFVQGDPGALLFVEFYGDSEAEALAALDRLEARWRAGRHGYAFVRAVAPAERQAVLKVRKSGLGLLMAASRGTERPLAFVEDTAVDPRRLPEYTDRFARILERFGLRAGFYGHASVGCLHIRPFMDLTRPGEVARMRAVAEAIRDLVAEYRGALSSEHGDGLARSEFNRQLFGEELYEAMRRVKRLFDPEGLFNPGKIVDAPPMTEHLRDPALPPAAPLATHFRFDADGGMRGAADRCMRIGACRKGWEGTMCPSYMATRDEQHSTRGRASALVKALSAPDPRAALADPRLYEILDLCLECKACKSECPLTVDMATLKSEFLAHYYAAHGVPLRARLFGAVRRVNRLGAALAPLSNWPAALPPARWLLERAVGIDRRRPLPRFARETLVRWFARRPAPTGPFPRGEVVFLADSFTTFTEPAVGRAAIELLERAGYRVRLESGVCCGRPQISKGLLRQARASAEALAARLAPEAARGVPVVGCEPSCLLTLREEHPALLPDDPRVAAVARQARLVEELLLEALDAGALTPPARPAGGHGPRIVFHGHCHQKALTGTAASVALLRRIPGAEVIELDAGCCGMAGSFGFEREHYDLSMAIGALRLFPALAAEGPATLVAATGVSCRQQIAHGVGRRARHPVELLRDALGPAAA